MVLHSYQLFNLSGVDSPEVDKETHDDVRPLPLCMLCCYVSCIQRSMSEQQQQRTTITANGLVHSMLGASTHLCTKMG